MTTSQCYTYPWWCMRACVRVRVLVCQSPPNMAISVAIALTYTHASRTNGTEGDGFDVQVQL